MRSPTFSARRREPEQHHRRGGESGAACVHSASQRYARRGVRARVARLAARRRGRGVGVGWQQAGTAAAEARSAGSLCPATLAHPAQRLLPGSAGSPPRDRSRKKKGAAICPACSHDPAQALQRPQRLLRRWPPALPLLARPTASLRAPPRRKAAPCMSSSWDSRRWRLASTIRTTRPATPLESVQPQATRACSTEWPASATGRAAPRR